MVMSETPAKKKTTKKDESADIQPEHVIKIGQQNSTLSDEAMADITAEAESMAYDFISFIAQSPSSYHAAEASAGLLEEAGFKRHEEKEEWDATPGGHFIIRGGALMAWFVPEGATPEESGFRIIGAHNDSPGFKLKYKGDMQCAGWQQAGVEVYGGPIISSWLDRELVLAGRIATADGATHLVTTPPVLRIPHLAIHLDRTANEALKLDRQQHVQPVFSVGQPHLSIMDVIAEAAGVETSEIVSHDLITVDAQPGEIFGATSEFLAAGRLDNLSSVFPGVQALIQATQDSVVDGTNNDVLVLACFDHEEIGSGSTSGAAGPILQDVLERTAYALGATPDSIRRMYSRSSCVSADAAHSIHPNYTERHDAVNHPLMGQGPAVKINANQRYASDAVTEAMWAKACAEAKVNNQVFVGKNSMPCGSTIGPITATRLGIPTVDVGIPILSMHSARELCSVTDLYGIAQALHAYLVN